MAVDPVAIIETPVARAAIKKVRIRGLRCSFDYLDADDNYLDNDIKNYPVDVIPDNILNALKADAVKQAEG